MTTTKYSTHRPAGREHFPLFPKGFIAIRIVQLVLAVVILGLCGFGVTFLVFAGDALSLFTAIATLIVTIYHLVAQFGSPKLFNYWAVLGLDIFLLIFWLISYAILAAQIAPAFAGSVECDYWTGYCNTYALGGIGLIYASCLAAAAGLGGVQFVLFIVSLAIVGVQVHRHRAAGLHCTPMSATGHHGATNTPTISAPTQVEKGQMGSQAQPVYQQQQQQQQQPVQAQHFVQQSHAGVPPQPTPPPQAHAAPQQQLYPQQAASPLASQPTGGSYQPPQYTQPSMPGQPQGPPYEAHGHPTQHTH